MNWTVNRASERSGGTMARVNGRGDALLALDVVAIGVFVGIGRSVHDHGLSAGGFVSTGWPFASGPVIGWMVLAALHRSARSFSGGLTICVATVAIGMALRVVAGQGTAVAFVFVALGFLGSAMLGWRLIDRMLRGQLLNTTRQSRARR
jgi:hypothetical protein